jgi:hypothetical protein
MKTSELRGTALDWVVAKIEGALLECKSVPDHFTPSTDWAQAGPIIEREWVDLHCINDSLWEAEINANEYHNRKNGPTPLIAAMRCYVASKLGEEVAMPYEDKLKDYYDRITD